MANVRVYTVPMCIDCAAVKYLLGDAGIEFEEIDISDIPQARRALALLSGHESMPQVFVKDRYIGQVAEIRHLTATGEMERLLQELNDD